MTWIREQVLIRILAETLLSSKSPSHQPKPTVAEGDICFKTPMCTVMLIGVLHVMIMMMMVYQDATRRLLSWRKHSSLSQLSTIE